jgi:hypothetical protein
LQPYQSSTLRLAHTSTCALQTLERVRSLKGVGVEKLSVRSLKNVTEMIRCVLSLSQFICTSRTEWMNLRKLWNYKNAPPILILLTCFLLAGSVRQTTSAAQLHSPAPAGFRTGATPQAAWPPPRGAASPAAGLPRRGSRRQTSGPFKYGMMLRWVFYPFK